MKCPKCGNEIANDSTFCEFCGTKVEPKPQPQVAQTKKQNNEQPNKRWLIPVLVIAGVVAIGACVAIFGGASEPVMEACDDTYVGLSVATVDLGLPSGILWAESNLGASSSEEAGDYFFWADTNPCEIGSRYKYVTDGYYTGEGDSKYLKYVTDSENGTVDGKTVMESEDDAANTMLGAAWSVPTVEDFNELLTYCTWKDAVKNGVEGVEFVGPNGNSIFFPNPGWLCVRQDDVYVMPDSWYWSNSLSSDKDLPSDIFAFAMKIGGASSGTEVTIASEYRTLGGSIRPVRH